MSATGGSARTFSAGPQTARLGQDSHATTAGSPAAVSSATFCPKSRDTGSRMSRTVRFPIVPLSARAPGATILSAAVVALGAALAASPAAADQDYPPGLFENSPVVPHGQQYADPPMGPTDPSDPGAPDAFAPLDDYCASVAGRTFHNLAEVKQ